MCITIIISVSASTVHVHSPRPAFPIAHVDKGGAPNSGRFLIPDKRSFMLDFSETHWCILANLIMPRGGATAYGSRVVCVSVRLSVRSIFYKTAQNQLLKTAILA